VIIDEFISIEDWSNNEMTKALMVEINALREDAMNCLLLVNANNDPWSITRFQERIYMCDKVLNFHKTIDEKLNKKEQDI
jgi:hypothetical protein